MNVKTASARRGLGAVAAAVASAWSESNFLFGLLSRWGRTTPSNAGLRLKLKPAPVRVNIDIAPERNGFGVWVKFDGGKQDEPLKFRILERANALGVHHQNDHYWSESQAGLQELIDFIQYGAASSQSVPPSIRQTHFVKTVKAYFEPTQRPGVRAAHWITTLDRLPQSTANRAKQLIQHEAQRCGVQVQFVNGNHVHVIGPNERVAQMADYLRSKLPVHLAHSRKGLTSDKIATLPSIRSRSTRLIVPTVDQQFQSPQLVSIASDYGVGIEQVANTRPGKTTVDVLGADNDIAAFREYLALQFPGDAAQWAVG